MLELPLHHFRHLQRLAQLRRCSIPEAVDYLFSAVEPNSRNWIGEHYGHSIETIMVDVSGHGLQAVTDRIQGLPRNIRPITDGAYLHQFEFFSAEAGLLGIEAEGVKILDFEQATSRDIGVFALVKDLLPSMTVEQYRVYNTFNSQYLRLVREPWLFTMPNRVAPAIDAGCYVGHKALALAQFVGANEVLALEMAAENIHVLRLNVQNNPRFRIRPIQAALSNAYMKLPVNTRNERSMAHSLTRFDKLKEANTSLLSDGQAATLSEVVTTTPLDDFTQSFKTLSALHISVNGHEPEVTRGALETIRRSDIVRISCPYSRDGRPVFDIVTEILTQSGVRVFGRSGAAVIAGKRLNNYHVESSMSSKPRYLAAREKLRNLVKRFS